MNFSKCLAAIVIVASIVLVVEASGHYCRGYGCHPQPAYQPHAPAPQYRAPHGPYHSYAVKPAVYGGPHLYTYHGYARQPKPQLAPIKVHIKAAAAYSPYSHAPIVAPLTLAIETPASHGTECHGYNCHSAPAAAPAAPAHYNSHPGYALHPIKAVILAPMVASIKPAAYPAATKSYRDHAEPAPTSYTDSHAALAGPLYHGEAVRPASYGAGHYYQALETLKHQDAYNNRKYRSSSSSSSAHHAAAPSAGGY